MVPADSLRSRVSSGSYQFCEFFRHRAPTTQISLYCASTLVRPTRISHSRWWIANGSIRTRKASGVNFKIIYFNYGSTLNAIDIGDDTDHIMMRVIMVPVTGSYYCSMLYDVYWRLVILIYITCKWNTIRGYEFHLKLWIKEVVRRSLADSAPGY